MAGCRQPVVHQWEVPAEPEQFKLCLGRPKDTGPRFLSGFLVEELRYNLSVASLSRRIAWNTVVQILGKFGSTGLGVAITYLLTHYLTHSDYGIYIFSIVFVTMFGTLADWGLTLITVREASREEGQAREIIGNVLVVRLLLAILAAAVAVIVINFSSYDSQT